MRKLALILVCSVATFAQETNNNLTSAFYPHPYIEGGLALNGSGESPVSLAYDSGVDYEQDRLTLTGNLGYNSAKKLDAGNGHSIGFGGSAFWRPKPLDGGGSWRSGWYVGGGAGFGKTVTDEYSKQSWQPKFGIGRDILKNDWSGRLQAAYFWQTKWLTEYPTPVQFTQGPGQPALSRTCSRCDNGLKGVEMDFWEPSPATSHHWFFHETVIPYWFHDSVTDPYDAVTTEIQKGNRHAGADAAFEMMFRF